MNPFFVRDSSGNFVPADDRDVILTGLELADVPFRRDSTLSNPRAVREYLRLKAALLQHEVFGLILTDTHYRVIDVVPLFSGTIDGCAVHPREVVKAALKHNAANVILFHNHPSGVGEPSSADRQITVRLKESLALIDVRVVDHLIVREAGVESFAERGLL